MQMKSTIGLKTLNASILAAVVLTMAYAFGDVKPAEYGNLIFRSALFFGGLGAFFGFCLGLVSGKVERKAIAAPPSTVQQQGA